MPTSTATMTVSFTGHKVTKLPVSTVKKPTMATTTATKHALATLRSLYNRAAKAFLQRDMVLTHSLILSAFSNLQPPVLSASDSLSSQRRKWDILRITLETTLYTSSFSPASSLPESLQMTLRLSPPSVIATMHTRSLQLFTPSNYSRPTAEFLPSQVLVTLSLASIKLECPQVGREMVEDWLHRRNSFSEEWLQDPKLPAKTLEDYQNVIDVYCLHLLPRLGEWDYAKQFLSYERELLEEHRMQLVRAVDRLHSEYVSGIDRERHRLSGISPNPSSTSTSSSRTATPNIVPIISTPDRAASPSPSITSTSTTSTHTAVPTRRSNPPSTLSRTTPTSRPQSPVHLLPPRSSTGSTMSTVQASALHRPTRPVSPRTTVSPQTSSRSISQPSLVTLVKSVLIPHLTRSKVSFMIIMCLVSFVSYLFRLRRRRSRLLNTAGTFTPKSITSHANDLEEVRRRLGGTGLWASTKRAVFDAIRMAGSGLA